MDWLYEKQKAAQNYDHLSENNIMEWVDFLFSSDRTQRYWKTETYRPAELMRAMVKADPDMMATSFRELFEENRDLEGRIDRFKFYCDEQLSRMRRNDRSFRESAHHQDNAIISYYLLMRYPETYSYYTRELHEKWVDFLGAKPLDEAEDMPRYQKMMRTIATFMKRDEELVQLLAGRSHASEAPVPLLTTYEMSGLI